MRKIIDEYKKCAGGFKFFGALLMMLVVIAIGPIIGFGVAYGLDLSKNLQGTVTVGSLVVWIIVVAPVIRHIYKWMDDIDV